MKLIRLKITDPNGFRSLHPGFEHHFRTEWILSEKEDFTPFICAGPNGSGKSNLLEVLAAIFFHLDCKSLINRPELFEYDEENIPYGYQEQDATPDAFELEFYGKPFAGFGLKTEEDYPRILVVKEVGLGPKYYILNGIGFDRDTPLDSQLIKAILPDYILAYSSGENEILSLPFFKMRFIHFDEYVDAIRKETHYSCPPDGTPEGRLSFLDQDFGQAIMLSNFILGNEEQLKPFSSEIGLEGVHYFRIILRDILYPSGHGVSSDISTFSPATSKSEQAETKSNQHPLLQNARLIQEKLTKCATASFTDSDTIYLDFWMDESCKNAFQLHFGDSLALFQSFQLLLTLNLYSVSNRQKLELYQSSSLFFNETIPTLPSDQRIIRFKDVVLKKRGVDATVYSKALSDGENQFLHILGLCTLYRDKSVLFLLDEPETHFNPDWRSKFITKLRECFPDSNHFREMLITTHAPFLISDSKPDKVLVFKKEEEEIRVSQPEYNTLGASINKITMKTFSKLETIGNYAEATLKEFRDRFNDGEEPEKLIDDINNTLGDSIEKIFLIKTILDRTEG